MPGPVLGTDSGQITEGIIMECKQNYKAKTNDELSLSKGQLVEIVKLLDGAKYCIVKYISNHEERPTKSKKFPIFSTNSSSTSSKKQDNGVVPCYVLKTYESSFAEGQYEYFGINFLLNHCIF